jgi:hypothetical protein
MQRILRPLNVIATVLTLASGLAVLVQDLVVAGYREFHRDWVLFVAAYCAFHAFLLHQLLRRGPWLPWLIAARAAAAYAFLLNLTSLWPQWRYWTPGRYVYQLLDVPGVFNLGLFTLIFLGRGAGNTWSLLAFTDHWWRPLRRSHPFAGRLVTAGFVAGLVFPIWTFLVVITEEAKMTTDLRRRGDTNYHVQIAYDCTVTRVVVRMEDGRMGSYTGSPGDCCARAAPQKG